MRRLAAAAVAAFVAAAAAVLSIGAAAPAGASTYYDYWGYWHKAPGATSWQYSSVGPSGYYLKAGTQVEGWRFAIGTAGPGDPEPRPVSVTYDQYCAGRDSDKTYRVLLVVDYGTQSGAPSGPVYSCEGFDDQPNGSTVLTLQHTERDSGGLICAIDGYPHSGCGEVVSSPAPTRSATQPAAPRTTAPPHTLTRSGGGAAPTSSSTGTAASPTARPSGSARVGAAAAPTASTATVTGSSAPTETPPPDTALVAKPFTPARKASTPVGGFVAGCVLLAALLATAVAVRRRRA